MNDKQIDAIIDDIMNLDKKAEFLPIVTPDGKETLVSVDTVMKAIGLSKLHEGEISPVILGEQVIFDHKDRISGNRYVFYTHSRVNTAFDLTVCVMNKDNKLIKRGVVAELCGESYLFARFMENLYQEFSFAFAYPATTTILNMAKAGLAGNEVDEGNWEPLLNGNKITDNGEVIPPGFKLTEGDQSKGVIVQVLEDSDLPHNAKGEIAEVARYNTPTFPNKSKIGFGPKDKN